MVKIEQWNFNSIFLTTFYQHTNKGDKWNEGVKSEQQKLLVGGWVEKPFCQEVLQHCLWKRNLVTSCRVFKSIKACVCSANHFSGQNKSNKHARLTNVNRWPVQVNMMSSSLSRSRDWRWAPASGSSLWGCQSICAWGWRLALNQVNNFLVDTIFAKLFLILK